MSRLIDAGRTVEPVSRDHFLRRERGQENINFPCSADYEQDWQPYPVDPSLAICDDHTCVHTFARVVLAITINTSFVFLQPMIPPKRFDIFSPLTGGCS